VNVVDSFKSLLITIRSSIVAAGTSKDKVVRSSLTLITAPSYETSPSERPGIHMEVVVVAAADEAKSARDKSLDIVM
jgi:hypothetical protein